MPRLAAVLFDLDGTLLDSAPDIHQALNHMLKEDGRSTLSLEQVKAMTGDGTMEMCRRALLQTGGVAADDLYPYVQKFVAAYRSLPPAPEQIYPHVRETLEALVKAGIKMGICTNKSEGSTIALLDALELKQYFGFIAGGDTFPYHKPHPGHVTGILDALGVTAEETVFVGDGPRDVAACKAAGVICLVVTHGYDQDYQNMGADRLIDGMDELIPTSKTLGFQI